MNLLYAYPIIIPMSSGGGSGDIPIELIWSTLIVVNVIWIFIFVIALIHNAKINKGETYKDRLSDREYFFWYSMFSIAIDALIVFFGLIFWVSTLL